jgi:hypothetical protein
MRQTQENIAKLTHHLDALTTAVDSFRETCGPMIAPECDDNPCIFCMGLQSAMTAGRDMLERLRDALLEEVAFAAAGDAGTDA